MQSKLVLSFLSLIALAAGGLITGCDSDATIAKSGVGESCDSSADCNEGLKCLQGACYKSGSGTGGGGNEGGEGTGTGATGATGPKPPVLGGEGESCTRAADCEPGLGCFNNRCTESGGEGGAGSDPVRLGQVNEACRVTADCAAGLACRLSPLSPTISVCTPAGGAIEATGKSCNGAECREAADCCQLPVELHVAWTAGTPFGTGAKSCSELKAKLADVECDGIVAANANNAMCAAYATYCTCDDTWSCSEGGLCVYEAPCTEDKADVVGGCPTYSRAGYGLLGYAATAAAICNDDGYCAGQVTAESGCTNDASCLDEPVADDLNDTCAAGECTCVKATKQCYRKCDSDLDCPAGTVQGPVIDAAAALVAGGPRICDEDLSVCVPADSCTTNESCIRRFNDVNAVCLNGACQPSCATDYDCNEGVISSANYTSICNANKVCEPLGCEEDTECAATANGVKLFCTAPPAFEPGTDVSSAITD